MAVRSVRFAALWAALFGLLLGTSDGAEAQRSQESNRSQVMNAGTVGIVTGNVNGTYIRIAADLAAVLDNGDELRILPILGRGAIQNIADILYLKGVDVGITQSDVLAYLKREKLFGSLEGRIHYITKLYNEEIHILARPEIRTIEDLAGKTINVDLVGSGTAMTASVILDALKIEAKLVNHDQALAIERMRKGEIAATIYVAGKPARIFADLKGDAGFHFLPVPYTKELAEVYLPSELSGAEYPGLVAADQRVETIAVGAVMAVFNWSKNGSRYRKVERFIEAFFQNFPELRKPPRHPKWQEVNLAATVPGWTRFPAAAEILEKSEAQARAATKREFAKFLANQDLPDQGKSLSRQDQEALFERFLQWQQQQARAQ